jgi:hypothetical protein
VFNRDVGERQRCGFQASDGDAFLSGGTTRQIQRRTIRDKSIAVEQESSCTMPGVAARELQSEDRGRLGVGERIQKETSVVGRIAVNATTSGKQQRSVPGEVTRSAMAV